MSAVTFRPAKREDVSLLIGLAGGTGSGKTFSAMRLASGMAGGKRFAVIDTENGRARHYADQFAFDCADLRAPFRPDAYADAIESAAEQGYGVILVDSFSHEHAGDGGLLDWHEDELDRMAGDDWKKRDAVKMTAWIKPKMSHKAMVSRLLQVNAHLILCFRAEEKIEIVKVDGKTVVRPKKSLTGLDGWIPVSEKNLPYELTLSFLLTADHPGLPKPIKLQEQHKAMVPLDRPITEDTGRALAAWAAGGEAAKESGGESRSALDGDTSEGDAATSASSSPAVISRDQVRRLFAIATSAGVGEDQLRAMVDAIAGVSSTKEIPRDKYEALVAAVEAAGGDDGESSFARRAAEAQARVPS